MGKREFAPEHGSVASNVVDVGWKGFRGWRQRRAYADPADELRIAARSDHTADAMCSRQMERGYFQIMAYRAGGGADLLITRDGSAKFAVDRKFMRSLGFRWKRRWCG